MDVNLAIAIRKKARELGQMEEAAVGLISQAVSLVSGAIKKAMSQIGNHKIATGIRKIVWGI